MSAARAWQAPEASALSLTGPCLLQGATPAVCFSVACSPSAPTVHLVPMQASLRARAKEGRDTKEPAALCSIQPPLALRPAATGCCCYWPWSLCKRGHPPRGRTNASPHCTGLLSPLPPLLHSYTPTPATLPPLLRQRAAQVDQALPLRDLRKACERKASVTTHHQHQRSPPFFNPLL